MLKVIGIKNVEEFASLDAAAKEEWSKSHVFHQRWSVAECQFFIGPENYAEYIKYREDIDPVIENCMAKVEGDEIRLQQLEGDRVRIVSTELNKSRDVDNKVLKCHAMKHGDILVPSSVYFAGYDIIHDVVPSTGTIEQSYVQEYVTNDFKRYRRITSMSGVLYMTPFIEVDRDSSSTKYPNLRQGYMYLTVLNKADVKRSPRYAFDGMPTIHDMLMNDFDDLIADYRYDNLEYLCDKHGIDKEVLMSLVDGNSDDLLQLTRVNSDVVGKVLDKAETVLNNNEIKQLHKYLEFLEVKKEQVTRYADELMELQKKRRNIVGLDTSFIKNKEVLEKFINSYEYRFDIKNYSKEELIEAVTKLSSLVVENLVPPSVKNKYGDSLEEIAINFSNNKHKDGGLKNE